MNHWREKIGKRQVKNEYSWRLSLHKEYVDFLEEVVTLARIYDWNLWGGGVNNYAVTLSQAKRNGKSISIRILPNNNYSYFVSFANAWNPNNIEKKEYQEKIGSTMDDALKYLHTFLLENQYNSDSDREKILVMGGAYERYPLVLKWEKERMMEDLDVYV